MPLYIDEITLQDYVIMIHKRQSWLHVWIQPRDQLPGCQDDALIKGRGSAGGKRREPIVVSLLPWCILWLKANHGGDCDARPPFLRGCSTTWQNGQAS